jgi:hypothetical protein
METQVNNETTRQIQGVVDEIKDAKRALENLECQRCQEEEKAKIRYRVERERLRDWKLQLQVKLGRIMRKHCLLDESMSLLVEDMEERAEREEDEEDFSNDE